MKSSYMLSKTKENRRHSTVRIPFSLYECRMPEMYTNVPTHWHEEVELNYIVEGEGQIFLNGERYVVSEGDILIIPSNVLHAAYLQKGSVLHYDAFVFSHAILGAGNNDRSATECIYPLLNGNLKIDSHITSCHREYTDICSCIKKIFTCAKENRAIDDLLLKSELFHLIYLLEKDASEKKKEDMGITDSNLIRPALSYMVEHYAETITVDQLAGYCNLSKSYFMSCFKHATGTSAIEHLIQLRLAAACKALNHTNGHISDIAVSCGYNNLSNFNRQFKKYIGCSPILYQKESHLERKNNDQDDGSS